MVGLHQRQQFGFRDGIDLIDGHDEGPVELPQMGEQHGVPEVRGPGLRQPDHHVGLVQGREGRLHQGLVQGPFGVNDSGSVQEEQLRLRQVDDTQQPKARGLGLGRSDGQLVPHQPVQQRGFAHVGIADEGDVAAFERFSVFGDHWLTG